MCVFLNRQDFIFNLFKFRFQKFYSTWSCWDVNSCSKTDSHALLMEKPSCASWKDFIFVIQLVAPKCNVLFLTLGEFNKGTESQGNQSLRIRLL